MLQKVMPKVQAWERLTDPEHSGRLSMGEYHELLLQAGYSVREASKAACRRGWDRLSAGVKM